MPTRHHCQATSAAFDTITEEAVHLTTGSPLPADVERILLWLLNEDYRTAYTREFVPPFFSIVELWIVVD